MGDSLSHLDDLLRSTSNTSLLAEALFLMLTASASKEK